MSTFSNWPFAQNPQYAIPQVINYDLVIQEPYPGICFEPTNVEGGSYQEIREVNGCLWLVTNALWNPNTLQWEQDSPCDWTLPAYALDLCADGTMTRYVAPATQAIGTPVAWTAVWSIDGNGCMTIEPVTLTAADEIASQAVVTWNGGVDAQMIATEINVTDTSSDADSLLEQFSVGGVVVWAVRKDGTLVVGKIPASAIVGGVVAGLVAGTGISITPDGTNIFEISLSHGDYVDIPNAQTVTGEKTFTAPVKLSVGSTSSVGGNGSVNGYSYHAWGADPTVASDTWLATAVEAVIMVIGDKLDASGMYGWWMYANTGLTIGDTYTPTLVAGIADNGAATFDGLTVDGNLTVTGNETVDGDLTVDGTLDVKALATFEDGIDVTGGTVTLPAGALAANFEGTGGIEVSTSGDLVDIDGSALLETITSSDNSLTVTKTGQNVDLTVNKTGPVGIQRGTGSVAISTSGGGSPTTISIPTPYADAASYIALVQLQTAGTPYQATVSTYVEQIDGSSFQVFAEGDATTAQTVTFAWTTLATE